MSDRDTRLFPHHDGVDLARPESQPFVVLRTLEEGDSDDLRSLFATVDEDVVASDFRDRGGRQLSRRSLAFWSLVLDARPTTGQRDREALWPL